MGRAGAAIGWIDESPAVIRIVRYAGLEHPERLAPALDAIFFEASLTKTFASEAARKAFRERWLGRFLEHDAAHAFLALEGTGQPVGYLVGCLEDPARAPRFADIGYFAALAGWTASYPAHLHVNVAAGVRSGGIGRRLVEAFVAHAAQSGSPGVHVVTGAGQRNVGFYLRAGFAELARAPGNGQEVVMLGRALSPSRDVTR